MMVQLTNVPSSNHRTGLTGPDAGTDMKDGKSRDNELKKDGAARVNYVAVLDRQLWNFL